MKKKLLVLLAAGLVLVSLAACGDDETPAGDDTLAPPVSGESSDDTAADTTVTTDNNGNTVTDPVVDTDPIEVNPTFVDKSMTVVVISYTGVVRNAADMTEESKMAWPTEGTTLTVTGESNDWYRLSYGEGVAYISKAVVADAAVLSTFTAVENEEVTLIGDVNVRSYPSADSEYSKRGALKSGTTVTRVAVSENWSRILFTVTTEVETGDPIETVKEYYIHNNYIKATETEADTANESASESESDTAADTEATKE